MNILLKFIQITLIVFLFISCSKTCHSNQKSEFIGKSYYFSRHNSENDNYGNFSIIQTGAFRPGYSNRPDDPNPFSPQTSVYFAVPDSCNVGLHIFNITGQDIDSIQIGIMPPGTYRAFWYARNIVSGNYFFKFSICDSTMIIKMTILK